MLKVKKLSVDAIVPSRATEYSAGYDLFTPDTVTIPPVSRTVVKTDISIVIPAGHYGRVAPRSSLACKGIDVAAGVIDEDYRGNVGVVLVNTSNKSVIFNKGDRIAQLILEKISTPEVVLVDELDETVRGQGGWGSTGK